MLVFVDESGDPGFKVQKGSSPVFALAMVCFRDADQASLTQNAIRQGLVDLAVRPEFKFNKCSHEKRDDFFRLVSEFDFRVRAIVVKKELIRSERLRSDADSFYAFFLKSMLKFDNQVLRGAKVIIDGSGSREFKRSLIVYLRRQTNHESIASVKMRNSRGEPLVQLADMCVGAIARSYRTDRPESGRWLQALRPKIEDIWEFK